MAPLASWALWAAAWATAAAAAAAGTEDEHGMSGAQRAEWAEWAPFVRMLEHKRARAGRGDAVAEVARARGLREGTQEPTTGWLKTCAGWSAQTLCSAVFGAGIPEEVAAREDLGYIAVWGTDYTIDYEARKVTAWCLIDNPANETYTSIFRDEIGCTLVEAITEEELRAQPLGDVAPPPPLDPEVPWPRGDGFFPETAPPEVDQACLAAVAAEQFGNTITNTRAVLVAYRGQLVYEEYAPGITRFNRLLGWSATKTLTQAMVGILVGEGRVNLRDPAPVDEWYEAEGDARQNITVDMMLRMSSGTRWTGDLGPSSECLFWSDNNCPRVCGLKPLVAEPDTIWNYNSGSTYLLSRLVRDRRGDPELSNFAWPKKKLFHRINAHSMYIEHQPNGVFLGGGYGYGTARDWARFGLLYQRDGVWVDGTRILPEGWVQYTGTATPTNDLLEYGAHAWREPLITAEPDLFFASGFRNQAVYVFRNREIVVARFAMPPLAAHPVYRHIPFLEGVLACIGAPGNGTRAATTP